MKAFGNDGRFRFLLLAASFSILAVLQKFHGALQRSSKYVGTNNTVKEPLVNSISLSDVALEATPSSALSKKVAEAANRYEAKSKEVTKAKRSRESSRSSEPRTEARVEVDKNLEPANIPIYLTNSTSHSVSAMDYRYLASIWDRGTRYEDLVLGAESTPYHSKGDLAEVILGKKLRAGNVTVIFHTSPKTASSTLRAACMETQYDSCNLPRKPDKMKWPEGYRTPKRLTQLFGECPETRHFCVRGTPLTRNYTNYYDSRTFLHMFPFRNYDEWAVSALHQVSFRDGEEGCEEADELLDQCLPHKFELDFGKYTKSIMAEFIVSLNRLASAKGGFRPRRHHHLILYDYLQTNDLLRWLSGDEFGVPTLPGTERKVNSERPKESCKYEGRMIEKFHDCFSDELVGLH